MFVLNIGAVVTAVVVLRAMVVPVIRMRDMRRMRFAAYVAKKTGERGGDALRRQHYERK